MDKCLTTNKTFWNFTKPFVTNKSIIVNNDVTLIIADEKHLTKLFNSYCRSSGWLHSPAYMRNSM